jgi:hypothetical protein
MKKHKLFTDRGGNLKIVGTQKPLKEHTLKELKILFPRTFARTKTKFIQQLEYDYLIIKKIEDKPRKLRIRYFILAGVITGAVIIFIALNYLNK